jgi:hypothetical protein
MPHVIDVYPHESEPWLGVLVADVKDVAEAQRAAKAEAALPVRYLGIKVHPILGENGKPGRRRRFYVFTDEPA